MAKFMKIFAVYRNHYRFKKGTGQRAWGISGLCRALFAARLEFNYYTK